MFGLLSQVQNSCDTGYDVSGLEVELAPGESRVLYWGSRGKGYANRIPAADCVMADWLEAVYTDSQGKRGPHPTGAGGASGLNSKLIRGVQYAAWAYFFLYLDINLNRFSLLPNAVGWYLLSRAVTALEEEHPDLRLLGPLTFPLGLWALKQYAFLLPAWDLSQFSWLLSWLALAVELTTLYFHFQFLTDLGGHRRPPRRRDGP